MDTNDSLWDVYSKSVAVKVSSCVVGLLAPYKQEGHLGMARGSYGSDRAYEISGVILESEEKSDGKHIGYVLTVATPFLRTDDVPLDKIKVKVYLSDSKLCRGRVLACDFHYNIAIVRIRSDTPLEIAMVKCLSDTVSVGPDHLPHLQKEESAWLRTHSNYFKILPGDYIIVLTRSTDESHSISVARGVYSLERPKNVPSEVCCVTRIEKERFIEGGAVMNYSGEVIGIILNKSCFLPFNIVSRWWKHYRSFGEFYRPWIGCKVGNLHGASIKFLWEFAEKFPNIATGVIVEEVAENSPAYCSGICYQDVIVGADGKLIESTLEFYEKIWDKAGNSVKFDVLRIGDSNRFESTILIGDVTPDKFYRWRLAETILKLKFPKEMQVEQQKTSVNPHSMGVREQMTAFMRPCTNRKREDI